MVIMPMKYERTIGNGTTAYILVCPRCKKIQYCSLPHENHLCEHCGMILEQKERFIIDSQSLDRIITGIGVM